MKTDNLPPIGYVRQHAGSWLLCRGNAIIGRIDRDHDSQELTVMVNDLFWSLDGTELRDFGGMAVKTYHKKFTLRLICLDVAIALRNMDGADEVEPAAITPRVKPKITIDLDQAPAISIDPGVNREFCRLSHAGGVLILSHAEARDIWVKIGQYLCEPAGPGLDRRATPAPDGGVMRNGGISYPSPSMKARQAVCDGLETMWRMSFSTDPTEADMKGMARALKEMAS